MKRQLDIKKKIEDEDSIKISPFKQEIRITNPHKHDNYFEIIYLSKGSGTHSIDAQQFTIAPPVVFIIRKEQVHFWNIRSQPAGYVLIIKKTFTDNSFDHDLKSIFSQLSNFSCIQLKEKKNIEQLFSLLLQEHQQKQTTNNPFTEGVLKALLALMLQNAAPVLKTKPQTGTLHQKYIALLSRQDNLINNVHHYATLLNTTPQNLNTACRKETGQQAAAILAGFIISEAKRLLLYSSLSVSEIAYSLNFKDNSHFIKYFKRFTGTTPNAFRHKD